MNANKNQAEEYKRQGNDRYAARDYERAKQLYTRAIGKNHLITIIEICPNESTYYGNRSACNLCLGQYIQLLIL